MQELAAFGGVVKSGTCARMLMYLSAQVYCRRVDDRQDGLWPGPAWVSISSPEGGGTSMRIVRRGGRWVVDAVYVHGPEVTASVLQNVPVGKFDLVMNLVTLIFRGEETVIKYGGQEYPFLIPDEGEEPSLGLLREQAEGAPRELAIAGPARSREPLTRPDGSDPEEFYARVADAYREFAPQVRYPAIKMAEEADVPVTTVHRWIREARRRGKLPAGRKGKVG